LRWPESLAAVAVGQWEASTRFHLGEVDGEVRLELSQRHFPGAWAIGGHGEREGILAAVEALERDGMARVKRTGRTSAAVPRSVTLLPGAVEDAYRTRRGSLREHLRGLHEQVRTLDLSAAPEWMGKHVESALERLSHGQTRPLGPGARTAAAADVVDALTAAAHIGNRTGYEERSISGALFGNTKRLSEIRPRVRHLLFQADPHWRGWGSIPDDRTLFGHYRETFKPPFTSVAGAFEIPRVMAMRAFRPYAQLPREVLQALAGVIRNDSGVQITTVENEASFLRYLADEEAEERVAAGEELVIYTAGYASEGILEFLRAVRPGRERFRHWGDADPDGLRIALILSEAAGGGRLYRTDAEWVRQVEIVLGQRLTERQEAETRAIASDPRIGWCAGAAEAAEAILERGCWFEQEVFYAGRAIAVA
jgi:hypothetical protein